MDENEFNIIKKQFLDFLDKDTLYMTKIERMIERNQKRLIINMTDLRVYSPVLSQRLLKKPIQIIPPFESALLEIVQNFRPKIEDEKYFVGFEGNFGSHLIIPNEINSSFLTQFVCIEGIVTKMSLVRPKRLETIHYCERTKNFWSKKYRDVTSFDMPPTSTSIPTKDKEGNFLQIEFGYSKYIDYQKIYIQDMPENSAVGTMPITIEIIAENDLVDSCKAGDRVQVMGVYRAIASKASGYTSGVYRTVCIANHVNIIGQMHKKSSALTEHDIRNIRKISKRRDILNLFSQSIAPSLYGHEYIKKSIVLLILGGEEKTLANKTHLRGDINMLLIGDPSVGKSQLLRSIMQLSKLSISTTGKGSTGVGLTAAVLKDKETGERFLEAGAMVLADRGIICIDEFDKMSEIDRTAIHEVMEQQTVTIAKAGLHTTLNARCSVVAAANPAYSSYDVSKTPQQNIPLPDSILSRFDLLFITVDKLDRDIDRHISEHVIHIHQHNQKFSISFGGEEEDESENQTEIYLKYDKLRNITNKKSSKYLTSEFMRKYFEYAKARYHPKLTDEASNIICEAYSDLRNKEEIQTLPITARCLETMIRLSTAHAKLRLSNSIEKKDCHAALELLNFALNNETNILSNKEHVSEDEESDVINSKNKRKFETLSDESDSIKISSRKLLEKEKKVLSSLSKLSRKDDSEITVKKFLKVYNDKNKDKFDETELREILKELEDRNKIMVADDVIHII